jgi:hypothetical protein
MSQNKQVAITALKQERTVLTVQLNNVNRALELLEGPTVPATTPAAAPKSGQKGHLMTPEARKKISIAMKKVAAAKKAAAQKTV